MNRLVYLVAALAITPQLRAQDPFVKPPKPVAIIQGHPHLPDSVVRWMKDTVSVRLEHRREGMVIGEPRVKGDTALLTASRLEKTGGVDGFYEFAIEYRFERRGGTWAVTNQVTMMHGHGRMAPDTADVKRKP